MSFSLPPSRYEHLQSEYEQPYFGQIESFLESERSEDKIIYPAQVDIFKAFYLTPWDEIKVVILGQDPYHGEGQAMGLSFSVPEGITLPPSLKNIYKELAQEYPGYDINQSGDLTRRADQGVVLLNSILTVRAEQAASHSKIGRQTFTDEVIRKISDHKSGVVFLLRGAYAQSKKTLIDISQHHILESVHPSPLSAHRGWFGSDQFKLCNDYLISLGKSPILR